MKKPIVKLINHTPMPQETVAWNWAIMAESNYPKSVKRMSKKKLRELFKNINGQAHMAVLEMVNLNFSLENVSRALQQQLTRTRTASYCIQSLRVVRCDRFAERGDYHIPRNCKDIKKFKNAMMNIQRNYQQMIADGEPVEVARGILPLNIFSPIHMSINFRNLMQMLSSRLCAEAQAEISQVAWQMFTEVLKAMPELAIEFLKVKCDKTGVCNSIVPCGRHPKAKDGSSVELVYDKKGNVSSKWRKK